MDKEEKDPLEKWRRWPSAPVDEQPKALYVSDVLPSKVASWLESKQGWLIVDVRTMPNKTDGDRAEAVKAFLEGVRVGSIEPGKEQLRYIELESKICGLLSNKNRADDYKPTLDEETLDKVLDFSSVRHDRMKLGGE